jgi:hypothetical protein
MKKRDSLVTFVEKYLVYNVQCRGHCEATASFRLLNTEHNRVVGAYCCPSGFASRVVYFGAGPDTNWFYSYLTDQLGKEIVQRRDLRVATRYGWELGEGAEKELKEPTHGRRRPVIGEIYWTRYPKSDAEKNRGIFLCQDPDSGKGCGKLFIQEITSKTRLCSSCR